MGAGASTANVGAASGKSKEEITNYVQQLSAKDKALLVAAMEGTSVVDNMKNISENEAKIHELSLTVMANKQGVFEARSMIEENRANIIQNYQAATTGNRQMALENSDAIYRNRTAILDALKVSGPVEENFRNSKHNESSVEYLENQCLLSNRVAKINVLMAAANADMIAVNDTVLKSNEEIVAFNAAQIEINKNLLSGDMLAGATVETNATLIAANKEKIAAIRARNDKYNNGMAALHASIKENRTNIEGNAAAIKERRKLILANRKTIDENGLKVANLLRIEAFAEVAAAVDALGAEEKENIKTALNGGAASEATTANRGLITENEAKLHDLHLTVATNKSKLLAVRSIIEENRALLMKNYSAAFAGNRLMVNQNTDSIFKNRIAILDAAGPSGQVQQNFINIMFNAANIDFLEHRSLLNNRVAKTNTSMAAANAKMIDANKIILSSNEELVKFNSAAIETNTKLLTGIQADKATAETNAARIAANVKAIEMIKSHAGKYDLSVEESTKAALENRKKIIANSKDIDDRRRKILENRDAFNENGAKVVAKIRGA